MQTSDVPLPFYGVATLASDCGVPGDPVVPLPEDHRVTSITLETVSRWYGNVVAVNDVTFDVGPGITGLLGPNGAGKTTLLHMMAGFLAPSAGTVQLDGTPTWRHPEIYRTIGFVPEREAVYSFLTARQFVEAAARLQQVPDPVAATQRAIAIVDLADAADRAIGGYSKGMRQRAKVAAALVHDPPVLVLDEPFNGMDPRQRLHMMDLLRGHGRRGPHDPVLVAHPRGGRAPQRPRAGGGGRTAGGFRRLPPHSPPHDRSAAQLHDPLDR